MRRFIQFLCGGAVFIAFAYSWLWAFSFATQLRICCTWKMYRPETFIVADAEYYPATTTREAASCWLWGTIAGRTECLGPPLHRGVLPLNKEYLLSQFPKGTKISVLYNPSASEARIQGSTLRVIAARPNMWQEEVRRCRWLGMQVLIPVPLTLCIYLAVRRINRRHARSIADRSSL
jgi:hypothetical protein